MRAYQIFASLTPEQMESVCKTLQEKAPAAFLHALHAAGAVMKARPVYMQKQPFPRKVKAIRSALSRVGSNPLAEELLAVYFLDCRNELLVDWLDCIGLQHEDGVLTEDDPQCPAEEKLEEAIKQFREKQDPDGELLLKAFASQPSIEWPQLNQLIEA